MEEADLTAKYTIVKYIANPMNILRKIRSNTWKQYGSEYKLDAQYAQFPFFSEIRGEWKFHKKTCCEANINLELCHNKFSPHLRPKEAFVFFILDDKLPSNLSKTWFPRCIENYTGARCEEVLLPSIKSQTKGDLFAAFLASLLLLGVLVIGAFYFLCR